MAFKDAKIGFHTSSTGYGGFVTAYDSSAAFATMRANPYWATRPGTGTNADLTARRTYDALVDFIEQQADQPNAATGGIVLMALGNNGGGHASRLWVDSSGASKIIKHAAGG